MAKEQERNKIEEAKEKLYRRDFKMAQDEVSYGTQLDKSPIPETWGDDNIKDKIKESNMQSKSKFSIFKKIFIASIVFFVIALGIASYLFFSGGNIVSSENVDIDVRGPVSIDGGDELSLQISITNDNNTTLKFTDLLVEYPKGTRSADNISEELLRYRESLGEIRAGKNVDKVVKAVLFGEEGQTGDIKITLEYRVEGSNAIFVKEKIYSMNIISSPVNVSMKILKEVNSNQEMSLDIELSSNSDSIVENVALAVDYPFGFEPTNAIPESTYGNNVWEIGDMAADSKKTIKIVGIMRGQDNEEKIFGVSAGKHDPNNNREIVVVYSSTFETVLIKKPFLGVELELNGDKLEEYVVDSKERIVGTLLWVNNLPTKIVDAVIEVKFGGKVLNKFSVSADSGFYNSSSNTIVWNKNSMSELGSIESGETGRMNFMFSSKSLLDSDIKDLQNPEITISVSVRGKRTSEDEATEEISEFVERKVLVNSDLRLTPRAIYYGGQFTNSGPLPPKAENATTYTVIWTVINSSNDVSDVEVRATLPPYVDWVGVSHPSYENISFNRSTGEVSWDIGRMDAGDGTVKPGREVSFQVALTPSVSHIGRTPAIVSNIVLTGEDDYTGEIISRTRPSLTTDLSTDSRFKLGDAQVVQ